MTLLNERHIGRMALSVLAKSEGCRREFSDVLIGRGLCSGRPPHFLQNVAKQSTQRYNSRFVISVRPSQTHRRELSSASLRTEDKECSRPPERFSGLCSSFSAPTILF